MNLKDQSVLQLGIQAKSQKKEKAECYEETFEDKFGEYNKMVTNLIEKNSKLKSRYLTEKTRRITTELDLIEAENEIKKLKKKIKKLKAKKTD